MKTQARRSLRRAPVSKPLGILLPAALLFSLASCRPAPQPPSPLAAPDAAPQDQAPQTVEAVEDLLRQAGLDILFDSELPTDYLPGVARIYSIDEGRERAELYAYATEAEAVTAAAGVSPDGLSLADPRSPGERVAVQWPAPPHFYRSGRFLLIYAGKNEAALTALSEALGPPYAGAR